MQVGRRAWGRHRSKHLPLWGGAGNEVGKCLPDHLSFLSPTSRHLMFLWLACPPPRTPGLYLPSIPVIARQEPPFPDPFLGSERLTHFPQRHKAGWRQV